MSFARASLKNFSLELIFKLFLAAKIIYLYKSITYKKLDVRVIGLSLMNHFISILAVCVASGLSTTGNADEINTRQTDSNNAPRS
jgi:multisubunit Na+/H+ antiporter MnhF subunit